MFVFVCAIIWVKESVGRHMRALNILVNKNEIVLIYSNFLKLNKFSAGKIAHVFSNEILLKHLLPNGKYDGYQVISIEDIMKIEHKTKYAQKIAKLAKYYDSVHEEVEVLEENGFVTILEFAKEKNKVVSIEFLESVRNDVIGYIGEVNNDRCVVYQLDEFGNEDGQVLFELSNITFVSCDSDEECILDVLSRLKRAVNN